MFASNRNQARARWESAGITSIPATFNDFVADSAKIKANGVTPIYEPISDGWHHVLWFPEIGQGTTLRIGRFLSIGGKGRRPAS